MTPSFSTTLCSLAFTIFLASSTHNNSTTRDYLYSKLPIQWLKLMNIRPEPDQKFSADTCNNVTNGCTNSDALNFDPCAITDDGSCEILGCTDHIACNYNFLATFDDESCDYCFCVGRTYWDPCVEGCLPELGLTTEAEATSPSLCEGDLNLDGVVGTSDFLSLLGMFGNNCQTLENNWTCGNLLNYQGHSYKTCKVGSQCWFAENLRTETFSNGDSLVNLMIMPENSGIAGFYRGNRDTALNGDSVWLYNRSAVFDPNRNSCPTGWHVSTDSDWETLFNYCGVDSAEVSLHGLAPIGVNERIAKLLKSQAYWSNIDSLSGCNSSENGCDIYDFNIKPTGGTQYLIYSEDSYLPDDSQIKFWIGRIGSYWTSTSSQTSLDILRVFSCTPATYRMEISSQYESLNAIRCIQE